MQNVASESSNNNDKGNTLHLQDLGIVSPPQPFSLSPIKSEFNPSYNKIQSGFLSETSEEEDVDEVEAFVIDGDADEMDPSKYYLSSEESSEDHTVDPETQARLDALLDAAGIGKLASGDGALADPEVLRRLTSSVSCALDEAAAALTRMRNENPRPQNERSLVQACADGDVKTVKKLLTEGRSVNETTDEGESLLSLACSAGYYELAQVLISMNASVEDRGSKGDCTPLMEAASSGFIEIVRLLINHGANVNGQSSSGNTPLMYACAGGHEAVVRVLLECGANVEDHNENGHTPLMEAASAGHVGVADVLLEYGAGINTHSNEFKESALTLACYKGHVDMVRFLLSAGADQEHKTDEMHTALMEASMDGHVEVAKLLLDSGAQVNMPTDSFESPLTLAACGGHVDLAILLIERGANIEEVNDEGYTPLMEAAREGHKEMVCVLLQKGAKINAHTDETQETALTLACCGGFLEVTDFLLKNGADIELGASTPLMEAAQEGHIHLVRYLLDSGAQIHAKTQTGDTALTYACENGHTDVADLLLSYGAVLEHESEGGRTPLMKACRQGHLCTVQYLISKNADVNRETSNNDHTPLSLACAGGHLNVVQLLITHNADPYHKLKDNSTMLMEAAKGGHTNVVQLILDYPQSVVGGSLPSSTETSTSPNKNESAVRDQLASNESHHQQSRETNHVPPQPEEPSSLRNLRLSNRTSTDSMIPDNTTGMQSINVQQLRLLQKQKQQSQELQHKQVDFVQCKNKRPQQDSYTNSKMSSSNQPNHVGSVEHKTKSQQQSPAMLVPKQVQQSVVPKIPTCQSNNEQNCPPPPPVQQQQQPIPNPPIPESCKEQQKQMIRAKALALLQQEQLSLPVSDTAMVSSNTTSQVQCDELNKVKNSNPLPQGQNKVSRRRYFQSPLFSSSDSVSTSDAQQVKIVSGRRLINVKPLSELTTDSQLRLLENLQDSKGQAPLANFLHSQFFIDHLKKIKEQKANSPSDASTISLPNSPVSPPPVEKSYRPVTPPLPPPNFGIDVSPQRPTVTQGLTVGNQQALFHPGANTTVLHNTIYTRSVPVPSPADVNQSTAICDRPKAKPVSKKEGKNAKKQQQLAAYHFAVQQQEKEALQLKQLLEMNEQLASQVVSQQPQIVSSTHVNETDSDNPPPPPPPTSLMSTSEVLADSMARSKKLASNAKEMLETMSVKVDLDPNTTRAITEQLESITIEEVERVANQVEKKFTFPEYAAELKVEPTNYNIVAEQARLQQVGVNFVRNITGSTSSAAPHCATAVQVVTAPGQEDTYQYFTVPSPGGPVQVQQYPNGFQLQYQVPRQEISPSPYSKVDPNTSPFSSPTLPLKHHGTPGCETNTAPSSPTLDEYTNEVFSSNNNNLYQVSTQTPIVPAETPSSTATSAVGTVKKIVQTGTTNTSSPKAKKREARPSIITSSSSANTNPNSGFQTNAVDPSQPRFPSTTETPSPVSVTSTASYTGMDVDSETESNHDTALTLACAGGHEELVELLLTRGAHIEHRDKKGFTPLILAATAGHDKVVDILLNHTAELEAQSERTKDTPLSLACSGGRYEVVELLLTRGANKEHRNMSDYTPLSLAASGGYVNIIKLLLTHGAEINSRTGSKLGISPLMLAAMNGHTAAVRLLLDMGSDINAQIETNRNTALTLACFQGRHEVVSLLLDRKANVEHRAKTGLTPLMEAASGGYVEVGRVLLDKGADVNAPPVPSSRDTALTIAADKGHCRFVELLLSKGAQIEVKNKKGNSPLWLAANGGHHSVVDLLCMNGADIDSQDNRKVSCLMAAFRKGHVKVVRWMVNHVTQFPGDQEMTRYIQTVNDKELLDKCQECSLVIRLAKNQQAERAIINANILLEELDMEKWREESKRAAQARKRERKKQKKLEKKEEKRKQIQEEEEEVVEVEEMDEDKENVEEEEEDEDMLTSTGREGEEGDSGIDANSQASCSSNEVKQIVLPSSKKSRKEKKKKKKSASTPNVPAKVNNKKNNNLQKNASTNAVPLVTNTTAKQPQSDSSSNKNAPKSSTETSSSNSKKDKKKLASSSQHNSISNNSNSSASHNQTNAQQKSPPISNSINGIPHKEPKTKQSKNNSHPVSCPNEMSNKTASNGVPTNGTTVPNNASLVLPVNGNKEKKPKEKATTPRKEVQQHLIFESTRNPAEREDFEATGSDSFKNRKRTSLMSLYSDGELIATSSGAKINSTKQGVVGKREEGWKEVVRKYLSTTMRSKKVSVPLNAISRVIGRGGSNINAIRSATSAHIEVEKQCKGQGERIITIKGNSESIKQAHSLINALIRDPDVDLQKLLSESGKSPVPPTTTPTPIKTKPQQVVPPVSGHCTLVNMKPTPVVSSGPPPLLNSIPSSMTFVKAPITAQQAQAPQVLIPPQGAPTPLIPGLRASAPRATVPRIVAAGVEKRAPHHVVTTVPSYTTAMMTVNKSSAPSFAAKLSEPPIVVSTTSSSPLTLVSQLRPLPTASAPPSISAPFQNPPAPSPTPQNVLSDQTQSSGLTEYSLFNDSFTKVTQQSVWGREDIPDADGKGMNFASVAANNNSNVLTSTNSCATQFLEPSPHVDASKAPGYRGSPVMSKSSSSPAPATYQIDTSPPNTTICRPRPTSMYSEESAPLYQQDLLKMVPGTFIPACVTMSRLNPRAPDFSVKPAQPTNPQTPAPSFNSSIPPPTGPYPNQNNYQGQPQLGPPTRWPYVNYNLGQSNQVDMMNHLATLALAHNQAGDLFTNVENTPPASPHTVDERKVPPRPIGTERAWKNCNNIGGSMPLVDENMPWLQQESKSFGGIGDSRHMFRNTTAAAPPAVQQFSRLPLPEDLPPPVHLMDNVYPDTNGHYAMNGATVMLLPHLENRFEPPQQLPSQQTSIGLTSLIPESSWDPTRLCMPDVPISGKQAQIWTKWSN